MSERWSTTDWGDACGPKPAAGGGAPGGTVTVTEQGSELSFSGAGRAFSTTQCWEPLPGLKRVSHAGGKRGWTSTCKSAAGDPRVATVTTRMSATDDTITFSETGVFEFNIKDTSCKASVSRSRSYKLLQRAGGDAVPTASASAAPPPPPPPTATAKPEPPPPPAPAPGSECDPAAAPARLEVRPTRKLLRPGEAFDLTVTVSDAKGCALSTLPELKLLGDGALTSKIKIDKTRVTVAADAPEGAATIEVSIAGKTLSVGLDVAAAERYGELLKARGLNDRGEDDRPLVAEIAATVGGGPSQAVDDARARKTTFLAIVGGVAALLALAAFILMRRGRRPREPEGPEGAEAVPASNVTFFEPAGDRPMECPECGREFEPGVAFCATDGTPLVPGAPPSRARVSDAGRARVTDPGRVSAPSKPVEIAPSSPRDEAAPPGKICPNCGETFSGEAGFCGKDGTQLVPIN